MVRIVNTPARTPAPLAITAPEQPCMTLADTLVSGACGGLVALTAPISLSFAAAYHLVHAGTVAVQAATGRRAAGPAWQAICEDTFLGSAALTGAVASKVLLPFTFVAGCIVGASMHRVNPLSPSNLLAAQQQAEAEVHGTQLPAPLRDGAGTQFPAPVRDGAPVEGTQFPAPLPAPAKIDPAVASRLSAAQPAPVTKPTLKACLP